MQVKKIVFPVDLTGSSYRIASWVCFLADRFEAELHIVYVVDTLEGNSTFFIPHQSLDLMEPEIMTLAEQQLEQFAEKYFEGRRGVKCAVMEGNPNEQIQNYIRSEKIDMVIVATDDQSRIERAIFGDMAEQIARTSPIPVIVINPFVEEKGRAGLRDVSTRSEVFGIDSPADLT